MTRSLILLSAACAALAQDTPPTRILKGTLLLWEIQGLAGELAVRGSDHRLERCRVTPDTFITRQNIRIAPVGVRLGDNVEIIGDFRDGPARCRAVTMYLRPFEVPRSNDPGEPLPYLAARRLLEPL